MQRRELVGQPRDREALAAPGGVLDQVALPRPLLTGMRHQLAHAVELLVAREDQEAPAGLVALVVLLFNLVDELAHEVEHALAGPGLLPQVARGVASPRGGHRRIARAAVLALVEGQEARLGAVQVRRDVDQVRVHREVRQAAAIREQRLARVAVVLVLADRVLHVLPVERVLELRREDRDAVQEEHHIEALLVLFAEPELADDREQVRRVQTTGLLVQAAGRPEVRQAELAARVLEALAEHGQRSPAFDLRGQALQELVLDAHAMMLGDLLPLLGLGGEDEVQDVLR